MPIGPESDDASDVASPAATPRVSPVEALAHDMRSPLAAVIGFAQLASEDLRVGNASRAALAIERLAQSAHTLEALLDCAQGCARACGASLERAVEQVRAEHKRELERRRIRLEGPRDAPALAVTPSDLYRVVNNLVGNAIEHMGGGDDSRICVSIARDGDCATLRVRDNGAGIAPEQRERVFEVAYSNGPASGAGRRGLGLAIVRELAASWGGRAWIESSITPGTGVCVTIPLARAG